MCVPHAVLGVTTAPRAAHGMVRKSGSRHRRSPRAMSATGRVSSSVQRPCIVSVAGYTCQSNAIDLVSDSGSGALSAMLNMNRDTGGKTLDARRRRVRDRREWRRNGSLGGGGRVGREVYHGNSFPTLGMDAWARKRYPLESPRTFVSSISTSVGRGTHIPSPPLRIRWSKRHTLLLTMSALRVHDAFAYLPIPRSRPAPRVNVMHLAFSLTSAPQDTAQRRDTRDLRLHVLPDCERHVRYV